jgi:beta-mannanase
MIRSFSTITALLVIALVALVSVQGDILDPWRGGPEPWRVDAASQQRPVLGVTTGALARNAFEAWDEDDLEEVNAFEQAARSHAGVVMWFADWESTRDFDAEQARLVAARGSLPEISWEPWDSRIPTGVPQPRYRLETIIRGDHDALLRRWGRQLAAYGDTVRIRFAHEMNGTWYPWAERANGNRPGEFARAWRHVRRIVRAAGATNVEWVWCPVTGRVPETMFPGRDEVDVLGVSGFNGGAELFSLRWRPFPDAFGETLTDLHALAPGLPVELSEISSTERGGSKAEWIDDMFAEIASRPYVQSLVWFDVVKETDWRITSSPQALAAFREGLARVRGVTPER